MKRNRGDEDIAVPKLCDYGGDSSRIFCLAKSLRDINDEVSVCITDVTEEMKILLCLNCVIVAVIAAGPSV
ncbi:hypothetical protein J6590_101762 [Homalodisca vitripennis]|nr:hypothetical protein J6590_101762 [Homalodisca vitripennis]